VGLFQQDPRSRGVHGFGGRREVSEIPKGIKKAGLSNRAGFLSERSLPLRKFLGLYDHINNTDKCANNLTNNNSTFY
jgi:hypothetical protein